MKDWRKAVGPLQSHTQSNLWCLRFLPWFPSWPWGYPYRWLPLVGFRAPVPTAAFLQTFPIQGWPHTASAGHAAIPPSGAADLQHHTLIGLLLWIVLCIWVCGNCDSAACCSHTNGLQGFMLHSDLLWEVLKPRLPPRYDGPWAISSAFHREEAWLPFLAYVCHEEDHRSPAFATGLGPHWFLLKSISIYLEWAEALVYFNN